MAKLLALFITGGFFLTTIVATLLGAQWLSWHGPEWMLENAETHSLGPGTGVALILLVIAQAAAAFMLIAEICEECRKG